MISQKTEDSSTTRKPLPVFLLVEIVNEDRKQSVGNVYEAFDAFCMGEEVLTLYFFYICS